ncbi:MULTISPECIES: LysR substrate-binding domain-containing protein [Phytobacter]|jgi:DNA-binding transcriptional LysR family regulator|uniref:LysR family transcriptional regulator n=1 Tax=Phytobacter diazotrophicus TaxID=395631 RepID=A0ABN6LTN7_9ENTR|nr:MULTISPECIES: LysR substrate-binding domain-containing protein [Phytobacter]MDU4150521.1 LysR substrate-binding domain-containing protein [Enterobacteriaceae bacterium]PXW53418.1 DNA-binding transcriptional LysR family regulator [Grimontella sp. AG753]MDU7377224.1 LysR substrate-binding domain-containing protein [Enterobacteriaceae bacterium]BBE79224.1 LysR family transcriptional regulator [Phytobacter sp. MRY16-398]BDD52603.1 LysR family transcriptional regulator [Phytobacter diazotrophicu
MESLNGFVVFVQVAEMRSFVAAGRNLGVSASAVGKSIARLEDKLGVRLFHRSTRSITLTAEGHLLLERSRRILAEIEAAQQELTQAAEHPVGRLRLSLPLVGSLVLPVLGDFMRQYPQIQLDLEFTDRMVDVIAEGYDAVLRIGPPADSRLSARKLGHFRTVVVASPEYLARCGEPQTPADLTRHACLQYRFPSSGKLERWVMRGNEAENELALPATMVCNNIETRVCFALRGLGIAWLPDFAIREALEEGALREVLADYASHTGVVHLLWPASKHPSPKLRVLIDFLSARIFPPAK